MLAKRPQLSVDSVVSCCFFFLLLIESPSIMNALILVFKVPYLILLLVSSHHDLAYPFPRSV